MHFFSQGPGRVAVLPEDGLAMRLQVEGWEGFASMQAIITQLGLASSGRQQFMHTLRNYVYVYSFGEGLGELPIGGVAMTTPPCGQTQMEQTGFERVFHYYQRHRLSKSGVPVAVAIGTSIALSAFLIGAKQEFLDPQSGISQFTLSLRYVTIDQDDDPDELDTAVKGGPDLTAIVDPNGTTFTNLIDPNGTTFTNDYGAVTIGPQLFHLPDGAVEQLLMGIVQEAAQKERAGTNLR